MRIFAILTGKDTYRKVNPFNFKSRRGQMISNLNHLKTVDELELADVWVLKEAPRITRHVFQGLQSDGIERDYESRELIPRQKAVDFKLEDCVKRVREILEASCYEAISKGIVYQGDLYRFDGTLIEEDRPVIRLDQKLRSDLMFTDKMVERGVIKSKLQPAGHKAFIKISGPDDVDKIMEDVFIEEANIVKKANDYGLKLDEMEADGSVTAKDYALLYEEIQSEFFSL